MKFYKHISYNILFFILFSFSLFFFVNNSFSQYVDEDEDIINRLGFVPKFFHPTNEEINDILIFNNLMVPEAKGPLQTLAKGKKSLLTYMPYLGPERNQRSCGNCWAWAATGAMEIIHAAQKDIHERLSVQYINSVLFSDFNKINACNGGSSGYFTEVYSHKKKFIPWSNENADFKDGNGGRTCQDNEGKSYWCPNVFTNEIQDEPNYSVTSLGLLNLKRYNDTTENIIQKIKYYINNDIPIVMSFCFTAANNFTRFWLDNNEDEVWDMSYIPQDAPPYSTYSSDCHAVLITGYNDESDNEDENYLEILNSWGTPNNRPQGIFKAKLNMDYNLRFTTGDGYGYNLILGLDIINPNFTNYETNDTGTVIINVVDDLGNPQNVTVYFNNEQYITDDEGKITIPNVSNQLEYDIRHYSGSTSTQYDNNTNQCKTYQYNTSSFKGTLDFSVNKIAEFTFIKNTIATFTPEDVEGEIEFIFKDSNGNPLKGVSLHINNNTYQTGSNSNHYYLDNIHKNTNYNFSFSKDGYIFDDLNYIITDDNLANKCLSFTSERTIIGRKITDNKAIINVIDEENNFLENEIIIINNKEYTTDENGTIVIENLSDGENYDIKAKVETGGTTINDTIFCFNYDHLNGTFDFSESDTITLTITKHYSNLSEKGTYHITTYYSHEFSNVKFPYVDVEINGTMYQTDKYGELYVYNVPYGTKLVININMDGYYPKNYERMFNKPTNLNEYHCTSYISGNAFNLVSTSYPSPTPTSTWTPTRTPSSTRTPTRTRTYTYTPSKTYTNSKTRTPTFTRTFTKTFINTPTGTFANTPINTNTFTKIPTRTRTYTYTPSKTYTNSKTNTNSLTKTLTRTRTYTYTPSKTHTISKTRTQTFTKTFTNTYTKALTNTYTNTPTVTKTYTPTLTPTNTKTPTPIPPTGYIVINFREMDTTRISLDNIKVIYNDKETYTSKADGVVYIHNVPYNQTFTLKFKKNGYKFTPSTVEGKLNKDSDNFFQLVNVSFDNNKNDCKKININTKKLKNNVTKIYDFSKIDKENINNTIETKFSKIEDLLNKLPKTAMVCKDGKNLTSVSYKKIKNNLKNNLKSLYNISLKINEDFKKKNKKSIKWLNNRKQKLSNFFNIANNEITKIPDKVHKVK